MKKLLLALRYVWAVYFFIWFLIVFLLLYPFFILFLSREEWYKYAHRLRALWGRIIMAFSGLFPQTQFEEKLDKNQQYIFVANHFSYLDILSLNVQVGQYFRFLAKSELSKIPLFKIFFRTIDISVDRKSIRASVTAYQLAEESIQNEDSLGIFPEGGIANQVPKMVKFKTGAFRLAIQEDVPIVPVSILDNWKRLPQGGFHSGGTPGKMRMVVHKPIETKELTDKDLSKLIESTYNIIQNSIDRANFA